MHDEELLLVCPYPRDVTSTHPERSSTRLMEHAGEANSLLIGFTESDKPLWKTFVGPMGCCPAIKYESHSTDTGGSVLHITRYMQMFFMYAEVDELLMRNPCYQLFLNSVLLC